MCEDCKRSAVALEAIRGELMIGNDMLARLIDHLGVKLSLDSEAGAYAKLLEASRVAIESHAAEEKTPENLVN